MGRAIGVGARHLRRIVLEDLGVSPAQLRDRHRAAAAQVFLRNRDLKISTVAQWVGVSSGRSLRRLMQRQTGRPPRGHRC